MLGRDVGAKSGKSDQAGSRGDVYDRSAAIPEHGRDLVLQAKKGALGIDRHDAVEILLRLFGDRRDRSLDARIVARAIEPAVCGHGSRDQRFHIYGSRHIRSCKSRVTALLFYEINGFVAAVSIHIGRKNFGALGGKLQRSSAADSGSRTGHKSHLSRYETHLPLLDFGDRPHARIAELTMSAFLRC